jgi:hypothetical protein
MVENEPIQSWRGNPIHLVLLLIVGIVFAPFSNGISMLLAIVATFLACCYHVNEQSKDELWELSLDDEDTPYDTEIHEPIVDETIAPPVEMMNERYVFPTKCPFCQEGIHLGHIEWIDESSAACPNCESVIEASKV